MAKARARAGDNVERFCRIAALLGDALNEGTQLEGHERPRDVMQQLLLLAELRLTSKERKLTIDEDGGISVADAAIRGEAYARAEILSRYLAELAEALPPGGRAPHDPAHDAIVDAIWETFASRRLGLSPTPKQKRQSTMRLLDSMTLGSRERDVLLSGIEDVAERAAFLALLEAWHDERAGSSRTSVGRRRSKWQLLEAMHADSDVAAKASTWSNDWDDLRSNARRKKTKKKR